MKKRIIRFLLSLVMLLSMPCVQANAATSETAAAAGDLQTAGGNSVTFTASADSRQTHDVFFHFSDTHITRQSVADGEKVDCPEEPAQEGLTFLGWFLSDGEPYDFDLPVTEDIHIYARFGHKVAYYVDDFRTMTQYVDHGQSAREPADPYIEGQRFKGWYTESGKLYDFSLPVTRSFSLYARFSTVTENPFSDVPEDSYYAEPVLWALEHNLTTGATPTTFKPNDTCFRSQVVTFLYRAAGTPSPSPTNNPFTDVKSADFFYQPVLWAIETGITNGTGKTTFGSYDSCTRAAVVTFLWRSAGCPEPNSTENPFVDVKPADFFYKAVLWATEEGFANGIDDTHFGPTADCNRAQIVTFLYRIDNP